MKKRFCLMLITLAVPSFVWAAAPDSLNEEISGEDSQVTILKKKKDSVYEGTSEHNRMDKEYTLSAQVVGLNSPGIVGSGINFGWYQSRNLIWQIETTFHNERQGIFHRPTGNSLGLHLKYFPGNTFYMNSGLDYRQIDYNDRYYISYDSGYQTARFKSRSVALTYGIGNQWQWENFTLGCEWVGIAAPIASEVTDSVIPERISRYDNDDYKADIKRYSSDGALTLVRFYLGASF